MLLSIWDAASSCFEGEKPTNSPLPKMQPHKKSYRWKHSWEIWPAFGSCTVLLLTVHLLLLWFFLAMARPVDVGKDLGTGSKVIWPWEKEVFGQHCQRWCLALASLDIFAQLNKTSLASLDRAVRTPPLPPINVIVLTVVCAWWTLNSACYFWLHVI